MTDGIDKGIERLRKLSARLTDTATANRKVSIDLYGLVMRNFDTEGGLRGGWTPLKPGTVKAKSREGYAMILQNTGSLKESFEFFSDKEIAGVGARNYVNTDDPDAPTNLAEVHEYGYEARGIPARPMLPTPEQALEAGINVYNVLVREAIEA